MKKKIIYCRQETSIRKRAIQAYNKVMDGPPQASLINIQVGAKPETDQTVKPEKKIIPIPTIKVINVERTGYSADPVSPVSSSPTTYYFIPKYHVFVSQEKKEPENDPSKGK